VLRFDAEHERVLLGPHLHRDLELMYFAGGSGVDRLGERRFEVAAGDLLLVAPGILHDASGINRAYGWAVEFELDVVFSATTPWSRSRPSGAGPALWWSSPLLTPFLAAGQRPTFARLSVPPSDRPRWEMRFAAMEAEQSERREGYAEVLDAYLLVLLIELARLASPVGAGLRRGGDEILARVFDVIEQRYADHISTGDVAAAVGLTPTYLTTLVRRRTGRAVLDWILERRMAEARALLLDTDLSAEAIAKRIGYSDPAYFSRRFRAFHGQPPGSWRTMAQPPSSPR
jgi:AraC-like DNA-binding protein